MRIVIFGAGGQLASDLAVQLAQHELQLLQRRDIDIGDARAVAGALDGFKPDVAINAAAYNLVDQAEAEPELAFAGNALGPIVLAKACGERGITLLHFSTDYVFGLDAKRSQPWAETDSPGPVSVYGLSKLVGESATRAFCPKHFVIRTCGLYGKRGSRGKGGNFVETMLRLADQDKPIRVVDDQRCTPSYTRDIAWLAGRLLESQAYGLYHGTNDGNCSWYEFAKEIFRLASRHVDCRPIPSVEYRGAARRPAYSVLDLSKITAIGVGPIPHWKDALGRYLVERTGAP